MVRSRFACPGRSSASRAWSRVDGLDPPPGERFAAVGKHSQCFELAVELQHSQVLGAHRDGRDRVGVVGVGLAVVTGVEETHPSRQLRRNIHHAFAVFEESLCERASSAVGPFDGPDPVRPGLRVAAHRGVAGTVGGEPARPKHLLVLVDDLDRGRQLVGIDPDDDLLCSLNHVLLPPVLVRLGRRGGHCYYELGSPFLSHASSR